MKMKKIFLAFLSVMVAIICMIIPSQVKASTLLTTNLYFGIKEFRDGTTPENIGYAIFNPDANLGSTTLTGTKIWQIVKYSANSTSSSHTTGNYYCVKSGVGFTNVSDISEYDISYNMKTEKSEIASSTNNYAKSLANSSNYNNLLALTDLLYLNGGVSTTAEREALLVAAGIDSSEYDASEKITDSDIEAVQQAAIWYFTNSETPDLFDNYSKDAWLFYRTLAMSQNGDQYESLSNYNPKTNSFGSQCGDGLLRQEQAVLLYRYLIDTAKTNASAYESGTATPKTKVTLYTNTTVQNTQPVILIEKIKEEVKEFDLSLRKYITKINGNTLTDATRVPNIDHSTIETDKTATYKHRKDPIIVKTGNTVTYEITVYNEGEKVGRATKIVDQLPTGLESNLVTGAKVTSTKGNEYTVSYDTSTNRVTFSTTGTNNLNAYDGTNLDSDTIEIVCTVTAQQDSVSEKILTNVAWISEEYDAVANLTITDQDGKDRDSKPSEAPNVNKNNMEDYTGNSNNQSDLSNSNYFYEGQEDDDDFEKVKLEKLGESSYNLVLVKEDANGEQLNSKATFNVNGEIKEVTGKLQIASNVKINSSNYTSDDIYTIKEIKAPDEYCKFEGIINITVTKKLEDGTYKIDKVKYTVTDENENDITNKTSGDVKVYLNSNGNIYVEVKNYQFDLKLVKRIVEVNGTKVPERILNVDVSKLNTVGSDNKLITTAEYDVNKNPVSVKKGDIVKYTFRVYNEGNIDGYASEISEDIPEGLEFIMSEKSDSEIDADTTLTDIEKEAIKYNNGVWDIKTVNSTTNKVEMISTDYLAKGKGAEIRTEGANLIKAFDSTKGYLNTINSKNPDYKEVSVYLKVVADNSTKTIIRNEAAITEDTDSNEKPIDDRDSDTEKWVKYEDDEDYDNIVLQSFDLALRKFIIAVSKDTKIEDSEYLKNSNGTYTRAPIVDTSKLNTIGEDGKLITTAIYNHTKKPVEVTRGDIVVYMLRVYNEGEIDGYASQIVDYLPNYLEFVEGEFNTKYGWEASQDGRKVTTKYLSNHLISKISVNSNNEIVLAYKEVPIMCRVKNNAEGKLTNIAEITECKDIDNKNIGDRDSEVNNVVVPNDKDLPSYKDDEKGTYIPGQQDDDDFEKVIVKKFDLALRKFITAVNDKDVTTRIPQVKYDSTNNKITYEHTKEPVNVATTNIVTYTIRVFNEGEIDGYASKVSDDIPDGLEFLPDNDLNKTYRWVMYDKDGKETDNVAEAVKITTDYLSKEQGELRMKENSNLKENPALLSAFDSNKEISDTNPDYADVKVAFKVIEPSTSDRIIVNSAQISDDTDKEGKPVDDVDSTPDVWNEGEDDQDREYIKLNYFDLALRKWVTQAIVIEDGKETVTQTGHKAEDDPEEVVKVEIHRKKLNSVVVKFKYSIRVTNEGEIAGYAKEITDYIPEGLKFVAEDNPDWIDEGNNVISTRKLENTLLQPGESAEVEVLLTWINGNDNLGKKINVAEISEDDNEYDAPDKDSTPDNRKEGEDDIDDAPVILSVSTGGPTQIYIVLGTTVLITLAGGIILIKKFVL